jgi:hypothetical protein
MLLETGRYEEAGEVLSAGVDSGGSRVTLLRAQLLSATDRRSEALELTQNLATAWPDAANVLAALGLAEQGVGRRRRAQDLLDRAALLDPSNEDLRQTRAGLEAERAGWLRAETERRRTPAVQSEDFVRVLAERLLSRSLRLQFATERDTAAIPVLRYADGRIDTFYGTLRRAEAALEWESLDGTRLKAALFDGNSGVGGGVVATRPDPSGVTAIQVDLRRPYWDLPESLAQGGARDRVEVRRQANVSPRVSVLLAAAANRYSLPEVPAAAESVGVMTDVNVRLLREPGVALEYSLDAEYRFNGKTQTGPDNAGPQPLPLISREVHAAGVHAQKQLTRGLHVEGAAGLAVDRLGGRAPFWTAAVNYNVSRHFGARLDVDRRLYMLDSSRTVTRFWVGLQYRF